jgi:hypothetical protein
MTDIIIQAEVSADKKLLGVELPPDTPTGRVQIIIRSLEPDTETLTLEEARSRLRKGGALFEISLPPGIVRSDDKEDARLSHLFGGGTLTSLDAINEDRGEL